MNTLNKKMKAMKKAKEASAAKNDAVVSFDEFGRPIKAKKEIKKGPIIAVGSVLAVLSFLYIPALFKTPTAARWNTSKTTLNTEAIRLANTYLKAYPDADFDNDGLSNSLESQYSTNPYDADTDGDGANDYWEIFSMNTDPRRWNNDLQALVNSIDVENETAANAPYKIDNVVLWADDLSSKTYDGVVKTIDGYQFSDFSGWAQFTEGGYAYEYVDGIHKSLPYKEAENAYYINGSPRVILYDKPAQNVYKFEAFGQVAYLPDNFFGQALDAILPDYGNYAPLKCYPILDIDADGVDREDKTTSIIPPSYWLDDSRFSRNDNNFEALAKVMSSINEGKTVVTSLYTDGYGETVVLVYGYTADGDLLIADINSEEPVGIISIEEKCARRLNNEGIISIEKWFEFRSVGHSSYKWAKIAFIFDGDGIGDESSVPETADENIDGNESEEGREAAEPEVTTVPEDTTTPQETTASDPEQESEPEETTAPEESDETDEPEESDKTEEAVPSETDTPEATTSSETSNSATTTPPETTVPETTASETEATTTTTTFDFMNF